MKAQVKFKLTDSEAEFKRLLAKFEPEVIEFNKADLPEPKAFKIIASLIEDHYTATSVSNKDNKITLELKPRLKSKLVLPESDNHFNRNKDRYQYHTLLAALEFVKKRNIAIDVGGHVGYYSHALVDLFKDVYAFEPSPINAACFEENVPKATLFKGALGKEEGKLTLHMAEDNTGNSSLVEEFGSKSVEVTVRTLDSLSFTSKIDLIKVDVQGFEEEVLLGGINTLKSDKPILIIEVITHKDSPPNEAVLKLLKSLNYKILRVIGKDYIFG